LGRFRRVGVRWVGVVVLQGGTLRDISGHLGCSEEDERQGAKRAKVGTPRGAIRLRKSVRLYLEEPWCAPVMIFREKSWLAGWK
jgi:hypothetical protein